MAEKIIMPKQGLQMTEGLITSWLVAEGEKVEIDQPLFEMETDKLTITIDSTASGTLLKIVHPEGDTVPITETIAYVGQPGESIPDEDSSAPAEEAPAAKDDGNVPVAAAPSEAREASADGRVFSSPRARMHAEEKSVDYRQLKGSGPLGMVIERDVLAAAESPKASPLARKLAEQKDVDLKDVTGSGAHGKIMAADVRSAVSAPVAETPAAEDQQIPISNMRRVIAKRMLDSLQTLAQANMRVTVDMTEAVHIRTQLKAAGQKISYNDLVLRCVARALKEFPMVNATMDDKYITLRSAVNLGMAVATENGLLVPVIHNADRMTLQELSAASKDLAERTKTNKLSPDEMSGGTFTVSNLGMFDIESFTAIINKPEAGILAVGKMEDRPAAVDGELVIRPQMQISLTYDHRILDGAPAAQFLRRIKQLLEQPGLLL
ncbi:MAG: 2-oxo acid dehydrogenase subunit E2 [Lachnospiraceae bacterium]|nr:2-oxo acid dehydrogenase subunit E2 [Lachnospiraceae bacterium]